jgi:ubiquinone/menaquinone biosynthesis C-methylase UbiE
MSMVDDPSSEDVPLDELDGTVSDDETAEVAPGFRPRASASAPHKHGHPLDATLPSEADASLTDLERTALRQPVQRPIEERRAAPEAGRADAPVEISAEATQESPEAAPAAALGVAGAWPAGGGAPPSGGLRPASIPRPLSARGPLGGTAPGMGPAPPRPQARSAPPPPPRRSSVPPPAHGPPPDPADAPPLADRIAAAPPRVTEERQAPAEPSDPGPVLSPPGIPSLAAHEPAPRKRLVSDAAARQRKKTKRRTLRIPDDDVPMLTPSPPPALAGTLESTPPGAEELGRPASDVVAEEPGWEAKTLLKNRGNAAAPAPEVAIPPPVPVPRAPLAAIAPVSTPAPEAAAAEGAHADGEAPASSVRPSGPGVFTDNMAIMVVRPVEVVSDLPAVEPRPKAVEPEPASLDAADYVTAQDSEDGVDLEGLEEVAPDRMSLPGILPPAGDAPSPALAGLALEPASAPAAPSPRRPPPPRRPAEIAPPPPGGPPTPSAAATPEMPSPPVEAPAPEAPRPTTQRPKRPWWSELFEDDMVLTLDRPSRRDVERDADFLERSLRLDRGSRLLDLACGSGGQAVELAARGYQVVGLDLSTTMLRLANEHAAQRGQSVSFVQGDMRQLNVEAMFDGVYCWATSFGYFDEKENADVIERVARALRPGGSFVLAVTNRDYVAPRSPGMAWFDRPGCVCMDEMKFDFVTSRLIVKRMAIFDTGKAREIEYSIRLYGVHELGRALTKRGFRVVEVSGHRAQRGAFLGCESPELIMACEHVGAAMRERG